MSFFSQFCQSIIVIDVSVAATLLFSVSPPLFVVVYGRRTSDRSMKLMWWKTTGLSLWAIGCSIKIPRPVSQHVPVPLLRCGACDKLLSYYHRLSAHSIDDPLSEISPHCLLKLLRFSVTFLFCVLGWTDNIVLFEQRSDRILCCNFWKLHFVSR